MNPLIDIISVVLFFAAYKLYNIFVATFVAIVVTLIQTAWQWFKHHRLNWMHISTLLLVIIAGGTTLILHDALYIKLKLTLVYWIFAIVCFISQILNKPLIKKIMCGKVDLPHTVWMRLNLAWAAFFSTFGTLNLWIAYHCSTHSWVMFKLYGTLGSMLLFGLLQSVYIFPYIRQETKNET